MRVDSNIGTQLNTTQLNTPNQSPIVKPLGEQIQQVLFGRARPPILDPAKFPELAVLLRLMDRYRKKLSTHAGDDEKEYSITLADDIIAAIDEHGTIFLGAAFLKGNAARPEVLVGALAHEIGHRPKRWRHERFKTQRQLTAEELAALCRHEETRADIFAGKALAELGLSCEPLIDFLKLVQVRPHPEYLPAEARGEIIRDAHAGRAYRTANRRKLFPEFDRWINPDGHLGEF